MVLARLFIDHFRDTRVGWFNGNPRIAIFDAVEFDVPRDCNKDWFLPSLTLSISLSLPIPESPRIIMTTPDKAEPEAPYKESTVLPTSTGINTVSKHDDVEVFVDSFT